MTSDTDRSFGRSGPIAKQEAGEKGAQQAVQANQQAVDQFKKAAGACLEARGYSVR